VETAKIMIITDRLIMENKALPELVGAKNSNILDIVEVSEIFVGDSRW
jgi:hypothetical protein